MTELIIFNDIFLYVCCGKRNFFSNDTFCQLIIFREQVCENQSAGTDNEIVDSKRKEERKAEKSGNKKYIVDYAGLTFLFFIYRETFFYMKSSKETRIFHIYTAGSIRWKKDSVMTAAIELTKQKVYRYKQSGEWGFITSRSNVKTYRVTFASCNSNA